MKSDIKTVKAYCSYKIICPLCGSDLTNRPQIFEYHSCEKCDSWVTDIIIIHSNMLHDITDCV